MSKRIIKINVVSDVVCPWCYIGKRRLEKAMHILSDKYDFEVEYLPFELNPHIPAAGLNQKEYLSDKFGGEEQYERITDRTAAVAAQEGLDFDFKSQKVSPNTRNAHRLIHLAKVDNRQLELVEILFKAYFTDGIDLSKKENLIVACEQAGLDREKIETFLRGNAGTAEIEITEKELQKLGISGVPFYIIDNKYGISGAQPPETFMQVFDEIAGVPLTTAEACDAGKKNC